MINQRRWLAGLFAGLLGFCGCVRLHPAWHNSTPTSVVQPEPKPSLAAYASPRSREREIKVRRRYRLKQIEIEIEANHASSGGPIVIDYYQCSSQPSPVFLLLPISGGNYEVESFFAGYIAKHGTAVALLHRPTNSEPKLSDLGAINTWLEENVWRDKRALDWIESRPELETNKVGVFGISMGAIQGVLLTAADRRIGASVFGLVGGDLPYILCQSAEPGIMKHRNAFLREHNLSEQQLHEQLRKAITCEPNTAAADIDPQDVLLVLAAFDRVVPFKKGLELRLRLRRPETIIVPTGHYSAVVYVPYLRRQTLKFFRDRFFDE